MSDGVLPGSFRDPSGFLFRKGGVLYRQVNRSYREHYDLFLKSGLYERLVAGGLLVPHEEDDLSLARTAEAYKVIRPMPVPFVSYPYEWSFSQIKDAALLTLDIQRWALDAGMTLKDSSAYNVQFAGGRPVFIDTLSFEPYVEGRPWTPYQQFCRHFLAPLALMSYRDIRFNQLLRVHLDGVPLDLASTQLPFRSRLDPALLLHVHAHAKSLARYSVAELDRGERVKKGSMGRRAFLGLLASLESAVKRLCWRPEGTEWADYYRDDSYDQEGLAHKKSLVEGFLDAASPEVVWDLGGNTGLFSRLAAARSRLTVSWDVDPACVELNYLQTVRDKERNLLPLLLDLSNPSPAIGWDNSERMSVRERCQADTVMALALIHHLAISNNVPLGMVAGFLAGLCRTLIVEFVPKDDHKVRLLLASRDDVFPGYTREGFEAEFGRFFTIERAEGIRNSKRTLYLMSRRP